jgi:hypothetical protein
VKVYILLYAWSVWKMIIQYSELKKRFCESLYSFVRMVCVKDDYTVFGIDREMLWNFIFFCAHGLWKATIQYSELVRKFCEILYSFVRMVSVNCDYKIFGIGKEILWNFIFFCAHGLWKATIQYSELVRKFCEILYSFMRMVSVKCDYKIFGIGKEILWNFIFFCAHGLCEMWLYNIRNW